MTTLYSASPRKVASRSNLNLAQPDPASIKLPESPEKSNRALRTAKSHAALSSTQQSGLRHARSGLTAKASKEQLNPPPMPAMPALPSRTRANSDAPTPFQRPAGTRRPATSTTNPASTLSSHARKSSLELAFKDGPPAGTSALDSLSILRHSILTSGISATKEGMSDYRVYLWLALLNIAPLPTDTYLSFVHRGRSPAYDKISNDVFRTLATDTLFKRRVTDASLTRVLNATAWRIHDEQKQNSQSQEPATNIQNTYVQGINVLLAPLLYASRSETQAYALLNSLLISHIPSYISPTMSGVHAGLDLIDRILALREPHLASFLLTTHNLPAKIYAFPSVLTLCACTPPLPEVLKLWDFLFAFGAHLNIVCVVAQLILMKQKLYDSPSPGKLLRSFPQLDAKGIIALTLVIVRDLPEGLYAEVVMHGRV
jgi:cell cycle arrest protein BUB2